MLKIDKDEKTLSKDYEEFYEKLSFKLQQEDDIKTNFFADLVRSDKKLRVLDLGCAEGKLAVLLALKGHDVTAADISQGYLNKSLELAQENSVEIQVVKCNIETGISSFKGKIFDVIFFMSVIEHLKNPIAALENIRKLLSEKGIFFIYTPNALRPSRLLYYFFKRKERLNFHNPKYLHDFHFLIYDFRTLEKTLNFVGFNVLEVIPTKLKPLPIADFRFFDPFFKFLSRQFPFLSDYLLLKCKKEIPIDIDKQLLYWKRLQTV